MDTPHGISLPRAAADLPARAALPCSARLQIPDRRFKPAARHVVAANVSGARGDVGRDSQTRGPSTRGAT